MIKRKRSHGLWAAALLTGAIVLMGAMTAGASVARSVSAPCSPAAKQKLAMQTNAHAAQVLAACNGSPAGQAEVTRNSFSSLARIAPSTPTLGGADVDAVLPDGSYPNVTQSETQTWAQGNTVVVAYNDSRTAPNCYSGGSYSNDNGTTYNVLTSRPFCTGHGTGYGDPVVVYDQAHSKWIAVFLASGCGGQGIGVWRSDDGIAWTAGPCAHNGGYTHEGKVFYIKFFFELRCCSTRVFAITKSTLHIM